MVWMNNEIIATMQYNGKGFDLIYKGKTIYVVKDGDTLNYYVPGDSHVFTSVIKLIFNDWCLGDHCGADLNGIQVIWTTDNKRSKKMYNSIVSGLQEFLDDFVDQTQYDRIDLDGIPFNDGPPINDDALGDIIPIEWSETESNKKE
ncbi:MAG: hypothetical protein ACK5LL_00055 [Suipraeoptans sp.]